MNEYDMIRNIVSGCKTKMDAINMGTSLNLIGNKIFLNIINSQQFDNDYADFKNFNTFLSECDKCKYAEDVNFLIFNHDKKFDDIQMKTLEYIISTKDHKNNQHFLIEKKCPHCGHLTKRHYNANYVVCGYPNDNDYDGCGMDWCFKCGKKLCKKWNDDMLYVESNQIHNSDCCKEYAEKNGLDYYTDFCKCVNRHVNRNK